MPKECTTHYHACDCREKMLREVCQYLIDLHAFMVPKKECTCNICNKARILLNIKGSETKPEKLCSCGFPQSYPIPHEHDRTERECSIIAYYEDKLNGNQTVGRDRSN